MLGLRFGRHAVCRGLVWIGIAGLLLLGVGSHPAWRYLPDVGGWVVLLGVIMLGFVFFALMMRDNSRPTKDHDQSN
jgi:hypothetical protein